MIRSYETVQNPKNVDIRGINLSVHMPATSALAGAMFG